MAREEIRVELTAEDDASRVVDDLADKTERLEADPVEVQVRADAAQAEAEMRSVRSAADDTGDSIHRIGDESDQSRSVLANMAGNATQDLGELGGVAGTAGVAIGQLAEYASEGNISLRKLANVAGPMLALGFATKVISDHMAKIGAAKAFTKEQVQGWVDAMKEGASLTDAMVSGWKEAAAVEVRIGDDTGDISQALATLGLSLEQFNALAHLSEDQIEAWGAAQRAAGADGQAVALVMGGAASTADAMASAAERAAINTRLFGGESLTLAERQDAVAAATEGVIDAYERGVQAANDWLDAQLAAADSTFAARDAAEDYADAVDATNAATLEQADAQRALNAEATPENLVRLAQANEALEDAIRAERDAALGAADAQVRLAEDHAKAAGETLSADERLDAYNTSLLESARTATPAARAQIAGYIAEVNGIPLSKATDIVANADTTKAAQELNDFTSVPRSTQVSVDLIATWGRNRPLGYPPGAPWPPAPAATTNVTVNMPRGTRGQDLIRTLSRHAARNGGRMAFR